MGADLRKYQARKRLRKKAFEDRGAKKKAGPSAIEKMAKKERSRYKRFQNRCNQLDSIIIRRGMNCFYCGIRLHPMEMTIEHLIAISNGGTWRPENLYLAHQLCNSLAGNMSLNDKMHLKFKLTNG